MILGGIKVKLARIRLILDAKFAKDIVCIEVSTSSSLPPQKHPPFFLLSPHLNLQTVKAPLPFSVNAPQYIGFS